MRLARAPLSEKPKGPLVESVCPEQSDSRAASRRETLATSAGAMLPMLNGQRCGAMHMLQGNKTLVVEKLYIGHPLGYSPSMPIKKTLFGFFVVIACSGPVLAAEPQTGNADEAPVTSFFERYTDSIRSLMERSLTLLGVPYRFGGTSTITGLDCSAFVGKVFSDALGFGMPRTAAEMSQMGEQVKLTDLKPGDLVFFNTMRRAFSHVGIYVGDYQFVHAPSAGGVVRVEDMRQNYWAARYDGARRVLPGSSARPAQAN